MQCVTLHRPNSTVSGKANWRRQIEATGGAQTGINSGNGTGCGFRHGGNNGNGASPVENAYQAPLVFVSRGVSQLSLLCQVMGEES